MRERFIKEYLNNCIGFLEASKEDKLHRNNFNCSANPSDDYITRFMLPYVLHQVDDDNYILLNREYKPLGIPFYSCIVDYSEYKDFIINKDLIDFSFFIEERHYFYNDWDKPFKCWTSCKKSDKNKYILLLRNVFKKIID